jgi:hypothetical protein
MRLVFRPPNPRRVLVFYCHLSVERKDGEVLSWDGRQSSCRAEFSPLSRSISLQRSPKLRPRVKSGVE